ncbi:MAG TPA: MtnX-like HAD-IB family phosphatase [Syntrophales bacterium]|nr:MtnX-like HAD-IB family phosphatase [Syntrophales bacterium]
MRSAPTNRKTADPADSTGALPFRGGRTLAVCDFDGTVCTVDMGNAILNRFSRTKWEEIDRAYCAREIGSLTAYRMLTPILRGSRKGMADFVRKNARLDPEFPAFVRFCRELGVDVMILSDGLDFYIETFLEQFDLQGIDYYANRLSFGKEDALDIDFPYSSECGSCGTCKSGILLRSRAEYDTVVYIGDGFSDICPAREADCVFAKGVLYEACLRNGTACIRYEHFGDVIDALQAAWTLREARRS